MTEGGQTIGMMGLGEMGGAIARHLTAAGHCVRAMVSGRSAETLERAREAGIEPVEDHARLASACDIIFSVLPPAVARQEAGRLAEAARATDQGFAFVEANAVSPASVREIADLFSDTPVQFIDGGLVGGPPSERGRPKLYLSGQRSARLDALDGIAFSTRWLGEEVGTASGFKMSYAAVTKGLGTLLTAAMLSAEKMGFLETYLEELTESQAVLLQRAEAIVPRLPADAGRWVREMREIGDTFAALDLPPGFHQAAAEIMDLLDQSRFGHETRRTRDTSRDLRATVKAVAEDHRSRAARK